MSNLSGAKPKGGQLLSRALHALSTMIMSNKDVVPVVSAVAVAEMLRMEHKDITAHGAAIAAVTSKKFKDGPQSMVYNFHVEYSAELRCFIAVRRSHRAIIK